MTRPVRPPLPLPRPLENGAPRYKWEKFSAIVRELLPLWQRHWDEIATSSRTSLPFEPDFTSYYNMEAGGFLHILTVRIDGELVGYVFNIIGPYLHSANAKAAHTIMFWLAPEHRHGWTGVRLLRLNRRGLRERGVRLHTINVKVGFKKGRVAKLLARLGYWPDELTLRRSM